MKNKLTQRELKEILHYEPSTGGFTWKINTKGGARIGKKAGGIKNDGYWHIKIRQKVYGAHRLTWLYMTGKWPEDQMDHINHNRSDNRWVNLRSVTRSENCRNKPMLKNHASGIFGVCWNKTTQKWYAHITEGRKAIYLISTPDKFEAICARKSAENKYGYHENHGTP